MEKIKELREKIEKAATRRVEIERTIEILKHEHKMLGNLIATTEDEIDDVMAKRRKEKNGG